MTNSSKGESDKVTVVIPNWNGMQWLSGCLDALCKQDMPYFKTVVVDNGSTDDSVQFIKGNYPQVELIQLPHNAGFSSAVNIGIEKSTTQYIALLNTDTIVDKKWLSSMLDKLETAASDVAAINPKMLSMDDPNLIDDAGDELSWYGIATKRGHNSPASYYCDEVDIFSPCGGASLYRREFLVETGGFDTAFFSYFEDVDLGLRGRLLGYRYLYIPTAMVLHKSHGSGIRNAEHVKLMTRNRLLLFLKNIPFSLLWENIFKLLYGQLYFFIAHGRHPLALLKGLWSFVLCLPEALNKRGEQMKNLKIDRAEIRSIIHSRIPSPPLSRLVVDSVMRIFRRLKLSKVF